MKKLITAAAIVGLLGAAPVASGEHVSTFTEEEIEPLQEVRDFELEQIEDAWEDWKDENEDAGHYEVIERVRERNAEKAVVNRTYQRDVVTAQREFTETENTRRPREPRTPATPRLPRDVR